MTCIFCVGSNVVQQISKNCTLFNISYCIIFLLTIIFQTSLNQIYHSESLRLWWTRLTCLFKWAFRPNAFRQTLHWKGFKWWREFCATDVCPIDVCPTDICPTNHLSDLPFVRPIHKMRHLSDLPFVRPAICPTYTQNASFVRPTIFPTRNLSDP